MLYEVITLWSGNGITDEETYGVLSEKAATEYGKRAAIQTLSRRIAEDIYSRLTFDSTLKK